jgi:LPS export ABC transporter protein LptC
VSRADWRVVVGFLAAMGLAYVILVAIQDPEQDSRESGTPPPAVFLTNAQIDNYSDESGVLDWRLISPSVRYFDATQLLIADTPTLSLHENRPTAPWVINAGRAAVYKDESLVRLNRGVEMTQLVGENAVRTIETVRIDYYPNRQYAEAIYPVVVNTPSVQTRGDQMKFWFDREFFELIGNVTTSYEPTH